jgi:hypothetical protein
MQEKLPKDKNVISYLSKSPERLLHSRKYETERLQLEESGGEKGSAFASESAKFSRQIDGRRLSSGQGN